MGTTYFLPDASRCRKEFSKNIIRLVSYRVLHHTVAKCPKIISDKVYARSPFKRCNCKNCNSGSMQKS